MAADQSIVNSLVAEASRNHVVTATVAATALILAKLYVVSGFNSTVAVQIAGSAGLFNLITALLLSVLPTALVTLAGAMFLLSASRIIHGGANEPIVKFAPWILLFFAFFIAPFTLTTYLTVVVALVILLLSRLFPRVAQRVIPIGIAVVLAAPINVIFLDDRPWSQAQSFVLINRSSGGETYTETVVGFTLAVEDSRTIILNYRPRIVFSVPSTTIQSSSICSLTGAGVQEPLGRTLVGAISSVVGRPEFHANSISNATLPGCFEGQ